MKRQRRLLSGILLALAAVAPAFAAEVVDQSQTRIDATAGFRGIGGDSEQKLAQSFTAGLTGDLVAIRMPIIGCGRGELVLEVRQAAADGAPTGVLLNATRFAPSAIPATLGAFHEFRLSAPVRVRASALYAFAVRMDPVRAVCNYANSEAGDTYAAGEHFFETLPNPPGWLRASSVPETRLDLAFETIVDTGGGGGAGGSGGDCLVGGGAIPANAPVCRCLEDEGLREFRCALLHPDFFAIRRVPWPLDLGRPYTESWEVLPMTKLKGPIGIRLEGGNIPQPVDLSFAGKSSKVLLSRKARLNAPSKAADIEGLATLSYGGESFGIDTSLPAAQFGAAQGAPQKPK